MYIIVVNALKFGHYFYYSILVDMLPIFTTTSPPTESPVTTTSQFVPPTTTEQPITTILSQSPPPTTTQGVYFCSELIPMFITVFYITGVFLSLNGKTIPNDGYVLASAIGVGGTSLHCNTDRSDCCQASGEGHWYLPNGNEVMSFTAEDIARPEPDDFFSRNRGTGKVRLNRNGNPTDRGRFRCEIPNARGVNVTLYVNIGMWMSFVAIIYSCPCI